MVFDLSDNYTEDPEKLLKRRKFARTRDIFESPSRTPSTETCSSQEQAPSSEGEESEGLEVNLTPVFQAMAEKTLREFSAPTTANIHTGPNVDIGNNGFELKPALITMVQANQFCGKAHEDGSAHLQHFLEICSTFKIKDVPKDAILLAYSHFCS
jgi:hypothetical protein